MSLNIGQINFAVDANTVGLQKAVQQINAFRQVVNRTARSQSDGANAAAAALARQESAIKRAFQQTLNLQRSLRQSGASAESIARVSNAFRVLTREMVSGKLSVVDFTRSIDAFNAKINRSNREMKDLKAEQAAKKFSGLVNTLRELQSASILAIGPLSGLGARITALAAIASRASIGLAALIGAVIGVSAGFYKLAQSGIQATIMLDRINARFKAATGSSIEAERQFAFIVNTANMLGLQVSTAADSFSKLVAASEGTALQGRATRDIFLGVADAAAALGLSNEQVQNTFVAIEQMMSIGTVRAQELRTQLGNNLPRAFHTAADAMGVTTAKLNQMLQQGQLITDDFLPKFAAELTKTYGPEAQNNINRFTGIMNQLSNATLLFSRNFDKMFGISEIVKGSLRATTDVINGLNTHIRLLGELVGAATGAFIGLSAPALVKGVLLLVDVIQAGAKAMWGLVTATAVEGNVLGALGKLAAAAVGAFAGFEIMKKYTEGIDNDLKNLNDALSDTSKIAGELHLTKNFDDALKKVNDLFRETQHLNAALGDVRANKASAYLAQGFVDAGKIIEKLNSDEITALKDRLGALGYSTGTLSERLAQLFAADEKAKDGFNDLVNRIKNTPEIVRDVGTAFSELSQKIIALQKGPRALELYDLAASRTKALERLHDQLRRTNLDQDTQNKLMDAYGKLLNQANYLQDHMKTTSADLAQALSQGLDDAIFSGKKFSDVLKDLAKQILELTFKAEVLKPFENALSGAFGNLFGGASNNPANAYAGTASAFGNAFVGGSLVHMAMGGILSGPTLFQTKQGVAVGGEAGTEAVLPLTRTSSGRLGVYGGGGSGGVEINIIDQRAGAHSEPVEVKQGTSANGGRKLDIFIRDKVKDLHQSGELAHTMADVYGLGRRGTR